MTTKQNAPNLYKRGNVWWMRYTDHLGRRIRKAASRDYSVAMKLLTDALTAVEQRRAGIIHADPAEGKRPVSDHLKDYLAELERQGRDNDLSVLIETDIRQFPSSYLTLLKRATEEQQWVFRELFLRGRHKDELALQLSRDGAYIDRLLRESLDIIRDHLK